MIGIGELVVCCLGAAYAIFKLLPFSLALTILIVSCGVVYYNLNRKQSYWKDKGVDGPAGNFLVGTTFMFNRGQHVLDLEWTKQYGKTFGYQLLGHQVLSVTDLSAVKRVLVKDFSYFVNRTLLLPRNNKSELSLLFHTVLMKRDEDWRNTRNAITPAFTSGKIKQMIPMFNHCAQIFCDVIGEFEQKNEKIQLKELCGKLTIDVISRTALGIQSDVQRDDSEPLLEHAKKIFSTPGFNFRVFLLILFPNVVGHLQDLSGHLLIHHDAHQFFIQTLSDLFERRLGESDQHSVDFFKLLLSSMKEEDEKVDSIEDSDIIHKEIAEIKEKKKLTKFEILAQAFIFLLAGYETTATTLHFILFMLAQHSEYQQRCRDEINEVVGDSEVRYEHITKLKYVDQVISETLRMFPPTARTGRDCNAPIELEGIQLEKGNGIVIPIYVIHHDEEIYPNPDVFDPERFSTEQKAKRDPLAFLPFGYGPRNCIGLRFAQFELRVILVQALRRFSFSPAEDSPALPLEIDTRGLTKPKETLFVRAERL